MHLITDSFAHITSYKNNGVIGDFISHNGNLGQMIQVLAPIDLKWQKKAQVGA